MQDIKQNVSFTFKRTKKNVFVLYTSVYNYKHTQQ